MTMNLPIANGIINKPTKMSLTARLTIRIFDAVCNFRTRQTVNMTIRFPIIVIQHINEQIIIVITKRVLLRVSVWLCFKIFVWLISSSFSINDNDGIVVCIRCREGLDIVVISFVSIIEDEDTIRCCCCTAATDESNEKIDKNEINIDVRLE